ncbi:MAG: hypothetical protein Tsb0010_10590 [Parvularculaceae bacterium]
MAVSMPASPGFISSSFGLRSNYSGEPSPFTASMQRVSRGAALWFASYALPPMTPAQAAEWQAFLLSLDDPQTPFFAFDPDRQALQAGGSPGAPLVNGAGQTGTSINLHGFSANYQVTAGDYISFSNGTFEELHMATATKSADAFGVLDGLSIRPAIRRSPADNTAIRITQARTEMLLTSAPTWSGDRLSIIDGLTFSGVEFVR